MMKISGSTSEEERPREHNGNSTEFKFVFKSYSGVVARFTDLVALMSSMFKMKTDTSDRSAIESWLIPIECDWDKNKHKEPRGKGQREPEEWVEEQLRKMGVTRMSVSWHERKKRETGFSSSM